MFWGRVATGHVRAGPARHACCPAGRPPPWPRCWTTCASPRAVARRPQRRHRAGPRGRRLARRLAAGARAPSSRRARSPPPSPGSTTSRWWRAASTGRCTATAGSRPRSRASSHRLDITRWPSRTPPSWSPMRSATWSWPCRSRWPPCPFARVARARLAGAGRHGHAQDRGSGAGSLKRRGQGHPPRGGRPRPRWLKSRVSPCAPSDNMTHVVTESCIRCKYTDCVDVCPVDCFREGPEHAGDRPGRVHRLRGLHPRVPGQRDLRRGRRARPTRSPSSSSTPNWPWPRAGRASPSASPRCPTPTSGKTRRASSSELVR